jgi:chromosome partitioning protein
VEVNIYAILRELPDEGEVKAGELAEGLGVDRKRVLKACERLQNHGYVKIRKPLFRDYRISKTGKLMEKPGSCRIISISNHKGGVGKTTTAVNISACLAKLEKKVLLVDLDPQANASSMLGYEDVACSTYDILSLTASAEEGIVKTEFGFDFIPSEVDLVGMELELHNLRGGEQWLKDVLTPLGGRYDYIIVDCPPSLSLLTVNALTASDSVIIPVQADQYAIESLRTLTKVIELVRNRLNHSLRIEGAILTMHDPSSDFSNKIADDVRSYLKERLFEVFVERDVRVSEAAASGKPLIHYDHRLRVSKAYTEITSKLIENEG